jgi:hypothetical protein
MGEPLNSDSVRDRDGLDTEQDTGGTGAGGGAAGGWRHEDDTDKANAAAGGTKQGER